ncbi:MAG: hypothetical protein ABL971_00375 [Vicinamibacterales bacterium]
MTIDSLNDLFNAAGVILVGLTFFFGAGALLTGRQINQRQSAELLRLGTELTRAQSGLAEQQARAANAEAELARIRQQVVARKLTASQRSSLISHIGGRKAQFVVVSPLMDSEAADFADDLDAALREAGAETLRVRNWISSGFGVSVGWLTGAAEPDLRGIRELAATLSGSGIPTRELVFTATTAASMSPHVQTGLAYLVVGPRAPLARTDPK